MTEVDINKSTIKYSYLKVGNYLTVLIVSFLLLGLWDGICAGRGCQSSY